MNDYTTDEELSNKIREWWSRNSLVVVTSITLALGSFGGFNYWTSTQTQKAESLSVNYSQLLIAFNEERFNDAETLADAIIQFNENSSYSALSKMLLAKIKFDSGDNVAAKSLLQQVVAEGREIELTATARERLARIYLQEGNTEAAEETLLNKNRRTSDRSLELLGDIYQAQKNIEEASVIYNEALDYYQASNQDSRYLLLKINMLENLKAGTAK